MQLRLLRGQPSPDELLERVPETEFTDVTRTIVRDGRVVAKIQAQRVLNFRRARTILLDMQYTEYDAAGNAVTTGSSERATYLHRALSGAGRFHPPALRLAGGALGSGHSGQVPHRGETRRNASRRGVRPVR